MSQFVLRTTDVAFAREQVTLAPGAQHSATTRGREAPEDPDQWRTPFERDRDRIVHSKAFRRLKHKTQVFMNPEGDHFVTRMTHTLQVTQIGGAIADVTGSFTWVFALSAVVSLVGSGAASRLPR